MTTRGEIFIAAQRGVMTGKPRPVLIIQNAAAPDYSTITACLLTTELWGTGMIRIAIVPNPGNGLEQPSEVQVDQIHTFRRTALTTRLGQLSADEMERVDQALRRWLDL